MSSHEPTPDADAEFWAIVTDMVAAGPTSSPSASDDLADYARAGVDAATHVWSSVIGW
jgi:hypothetical protein